MRRPHLKRRLVAAVVLLLASAGTAYAVVTAGATGSGSGTALAQPDSISIGGGPSTPIAPESIVPLTGWLTNPNRFQVKILKIKVTITALGGTGTCSRTLDFAVVDATGPWTIPAANDDGDGQADWTGGSITLVNDPVRNQTGCLKRNVFLSFQAVK